MKKNYNSKKKTTIVTLSLVAVCIVAGLFYFAGTMDNEPPLPAESKPPVETEVIVPEIKPESKPSVETEIVVPEIKPESKPTVETEIVVPEIKPESKPPVETVVPDSKLTEVNTATSTDTNVKKPSDGKPKTPEEATPPTEKPKTDDGKDRTPPMVESGKEHEFMPDAPNKKPEYKPEQSQPDSKPQGGEGKSDGSVYVPGFGWIEDSGEENKTEDGNFDITGEKIGDM